MNQANHLISPLAGVLAAFPALTVNVLLANRAAAKRRTLFASDNTMSEPTTNGRLPKNGHGWQVWDMP